MSPEFEEEIGEFAHVIVSYRLVLLNVYFV
jgi:hypothetical protein